MNGTIICTNEDNISVTFGESFSPFLLENCDGIYSVSNNVTTSENTMTDGSTYQGSVTKLRNIVLTLRDHPSAIHRDNRDLLYRLFKPKSAGTLYYLDKDADEPRLIDYYVESVDISGDTRARQATVSLICPDPFFQAMSDMTVVIAGWSAMFEWAHEFVNGGEEFGARTKETLATIDNASAASNIGMTITISATGEVVNPSIFHVEQGEKITIGTESNPMELVHGDELIITTGTNDKHVYKVVDGEKVEINEYLSSDSEFIQLQAGTNSIGYEADTGVANMIVEVSYRYKYLGA